MPINVQKKSQTKKYKDPLPGFYKYSDDIVREPKAIPSSVGILKYPEGAFVSLLGLPGCGKTYFSIQECITASVDGKSSLYLHNESDRTTFPIVVKNIMNSMELTSDDLKYIDFVDMTNIQLGSADYRTIELFAKNMWAKKVKYWIEHVARSKPAFVVIDSFSKIGRRYIPQMFYLSEKLIEALRNVYNETKTFPVTILVHQKSGSHYERYDDSVVGGMGIVHETDVTIVLNLYHVDRWMVRDFPSLKLGSNLYTMKIVKSRIVSNPYDEFIVIIEDGKLTATVPLNSLRGP